MSLEKKQFYEFGNFRVDLAERVLRRDGELVALAPKVFRTLGILIENAGRLLEKDELMRKIWEDRFVEEGNLAFNIKVLRKALGDDAARPTFIETVPRRGYRFIAEVREIAPDAPARETAPKKIALAKRLLPAAAVLIGLIFAGFWFARSKTPEGRAPVLSAPFSLEKLSTSGNVRHAVVSPDGKNVIYLNGAWNQPQSVWLRQLETGNNVEIIPPSDDYYYWLALSPDGNFLYFNRSPKSVNRQDTYRVSVFGGVPQKILENVEGWMGISPDGRRISFLRCPYLDGDYCSLRIADAISGKNERTLVAHTRPTRIGDNKFSPDGKKIAFAVGQSLNKSNEFGLREVDVETGEQRDLAAEKFFNITSLEWLPDQSGLLLTASKIQTAQYLIWQISAADGRAVALTKDSESYKSLSLDKAAAVLISTQVKADFRLSVSSAENLSNQRVLADASRITFAPDGKIIFGSPMSGNDEIWSTNRDGSGRKQLTNDAADDDCPLVSADNKTIFFTSNRTGNSQIWRMNADGSSPVQITEKNGGFPLSVSPDGSRLFYLHEIDRTLWTVSTGGGGEALVLNQRAGHFTFSPDGSQFAFLKDKNIEIFSTEGARPVKTFQIIADEVLGSDNVVWTADGKGLLYIILAANGNYVLRRQPLTGGAAENFADLGAEEIFSLADAPDGKALAVVKGGWRHDAVLLKGLK